jgi:hypothetical protein
MRRALLASLLCARLLWPAEARADEESKKTCAAAFTSAQRLMRSGSLLEARKKLVLCGGPQCPAVMQPDCQQWLASVENSIPTVVFQVSASTGVPPQEVRLALDGGDAVALDGRALSLDPGPHSATFTADGFRPVTKPFALSEGTKLQREMVSMEALPPAPRIEIVPKPAPPLAPPESKSRLTLPIIFALSGTVLASAGAVYFGVNARRDDRDLESCYGNCTQPQVDRVQREYLWTNISIGVAAAGLATAVVLWLVQRRSTPPSTNSASGVGVQLGTF